MLRINQHSQAAAVKRYHSSPAEYYQPDTQELAGCWTGKGAERLGLEGEILKEHFERLCDNRHPFTGEQMTARMRKDRRVCYDFTFDSPKSVSIVYGITGDPSILDAFRSSMRATMDELEAGVKVRVRKRGQQGERVVGNAIVGEHIHFTARPVKGVIDPHLHGHEVIFNIAWDQVERMYKAIDVASIKQNAPYWQARFQKRFGGRLAELGYEVEWHGEHFELAGISRDLIERFSGRTAFITQWAERRGITDDAAKAGLGARTREGKRHDATLPQLRGEWRHRLTDDDREALGRIALQRRHAVPVVRQPSTVKATAMGSGQGMIARLRARAEAAKPELDAWESERRDWIRQEPVRRVVIGRGWQR